MLVSDALDNLLGKQMDRYGRVIAFIGLSLLLSTAAQAQSSKRTELTKGDLTGTSMETVVGLVEVPPGASGVLHTHPGEEAFYVVDGATAERPDGTPVVFEVGIGRINVRDVPHSAFKITGDKTLKLLTVHIVDKGKPMFTPVNSLLVGADSNDDDAHNRTGAALTFRPLVPSFLVDTALNKMPSPTAPG